MKPLTWVMTVSSQVWGGCSEVRATLLSSDCCRSSAKAEEAHFAHFSWALTATCLHYILVGFSQEQITDIMLYERPKGDSKLRPSCNWTGV